MPFPVTYHKTSYFNALTNSQYKSFANKLSSLLKSSCTDGQSIVLLCIGTDRSISDSLGPLVGDMITKKSGGKIPVFGTLNDPIHALNLKETLNEIHSFSQHPFIIAVDASLGVTEHVGFVTLTNGALKPGLGVKKHLPAVGDVCITGIVNKCQSLDDLLLYDTRLSTVMHMAGYISSGICSSLL